MPFRSILVAMEKPSYLQEVKALFVREINFVLRHFVIFFVLGAFACGILTGNIQAAIFLVVVSLGISAFLNLYAPR